MQQPHAECQMECVIPGTCASEMLPRPILTDRDWLAYLDQQLRTLPGGMWLNQINGPRGRGVFRKCLTMEHHRPIHQAMSLC